MKTFRRYLSEFSKQVVLNRFNMNFTLCLNFPGRLYYSFVGHHYVGSVKPSKKCFAGASHLIIVMKFIPLREWLWNVLHGSAKCITSLSKHSAYNLFLIKSVSHYKHSVFSNSGEKSVLCTFEACWPLAEKYLEFPKYKCQDLRGFKTSSGFTCHNTLPLMCAISKSLILNWVARVHEQYMEVPEGGAYLVTGHGDVEVRSLSEIPWPSPLWNGFLTGFSIPMPSRRLVLFPTLRLLSWW